MQKNNNLLSTYLFFYYILCVCVGGGGGVGGRKRALRCVKPLTKSLCHFMMKKHHLSVANFYVAKMSFNASHGNKTSQD